LVRAALVHNTSAGSEDHTDQELVKEIRRAGHEVVHMASKVDHHLLADLQREPCDVVVVAGGDGTVSRAACELCEWEVPLAILPLGTANNTALSLGLCEPIEQLIGRWSQARVMPFDLVSWDDGSVRQLLSESLGWGVFPQAIAAAKSRPRQKKGRRRQLERDRELFDAAIHRAEPRPYDIHVDGRSYSGSYLMVEVVNLPYLGPRLRVSPPSDPGDGLLELVLAEEGDRAALVELARGGSLEEGALRHVRGRHLQIRADDGLLHRDGGLTRHPPGTRSFEIRVHEAAVGYLRPA
jgi:diacylglycerol kinase (ATP)